MLTDGIPEMVVVVYNDGMALTLMLGMVPTFMVGIVPTFTDGRKPTFTLGIDVTAEVTARVSVLRTACSSRVHARDATFQT